jgi:5-methylcytosine-specific restriction endonuclease McrA
VNVRERVLRRDKFRCRYCGRPLSRDEVTMDHVRAYSRKGRWTERNLVTACGACNRKKGNRTPDEAGMPLLVRSRRARQEQAHIGTFSAQALYGGKRRAHERRRRASRRATSPQET